MLVVRNFSLNSGDSLHLYDGVSNSSQDLLKVLHAPVSFYSSSRHLFVAFTSDLDYVANGFVITWTFIGTYATYGAYIAVYQLSVIIVLL